jgi:hypothetical protein
MFAAQERATPPTFKNRSAIQATNWPESIVMERISGIAAGSADFLSRVLPFSLIVAREVCSPPRPAFTSCCATRTFPSRSDFTVGEALFMRNCARF